jgi:hypothetical protein
MVQKRRTEQSSLRCTQSQIIRENARWWCIDVYTVGACTQGLIIRVWSFFLFSKGYKDDGVFSLFVHQFTEKKRAFLENDGPIVWDWWRYLEKTLIHHTPTGANAAQMEAERWCWFSFLFWLCSVGNSPVTLNNASGLLFMYYPFITWAYGHFFGFWLLRDLTLMAANTLAKWLYWMIRMKSDKTPKADLLRNRTKEPFFFIQLYKILLILFSLIIFFWCRGSFLFQTMELCLFVYYIYNIK